ncbi:hypothetical protein SUGI_0540370 [Cryptomeria japonica]|nr:hypothetical protein SUGI_0540370 [Cryptomeria japonica]
MPLVCRALCGQVFVAWAGRGCRKRSAFLNRCGCNNVPGDLHGGYLFEYKGRQTGFAYNTDNSAGLAQMRFTRTIGNCRPFPWRSIFIQCW